MGEKLLNQELGRIVVRPCVATGRRRQAEKKIGTIEEKESAVNDQEDERRGKPIPDAPLLGQFPLSRGSRLSLQLAPPSKARLGASPGFLLYVECDAPWKNAVSFSPQL